MSFEMKLWRVDGDYLTKVRKVQLDSEKRLGNWIEERPLLLGERILFIGREVITDFGGRIDLLGIDQNGDLIVVELKRDKTPKDIIAQTLDYASWVSKLTIEEIDQLTNKYRSENLQVAFSSFFESPLPDNVNQNHRMLIVASALDDSTERIVRYLADEYSININIAFFTFFEQEGIEHLGRAWLINPEIVKEDSKTRAHRPWTGYWFVNVGEGEYRTWDDNRKYGFLSAGGGEWFSNAMERLNIGDEIFAYMKGLGYVGYGKVTQEAMMIKDFLADEKGIYLLDQDLKAPKAGERKDDPEKSEYVVGIEWIKTFSPDQAKKYNGIFANQNITCKLRDEVTLEFLKKEFEVDTGNQISY